ncbi:MAG TPA: carboxypeptidase regulatory-like domain-containing protein [Candidatus Limnocylindrales bacterium]|nr:carboxypeptidase regulatory-like domain-containing protein [Candidatus Limnocylindrales bacterium]
MSMTRWGRVLLCACASVVAAGAAWGQTTGTIRGTAKDSSGAVVPGTTVTATLTGTDTSRSASADANGSFEIPELAIGTYMVSAEAKGFKKFVAQGVVVSIGHVTVVDVALQVGGSTDTVTVEANAVQVETTSTQIGAVMTDTSVRELPLSTRNTYQLLQLQPGVQSQLGADLFYGSDNPGVVSVNGGRGRSNNYMVNGGDGNDIFVNGPAIQPSPDAIEEFRVITNTFDAEYGRNSGSVVNVVTKSGTNSVHGDFYEFLRNQALNTRGYFDPSVPDYKQNQFGATLGGPIKKDRTFIFGSYEGNRLVQGIPSGSVFLPTADEAAGNFGDPLGGTLVDDNFANVLNSRPGCASAVSGEGGAPIASGTDYADIFPNGVVPTQCFDPTAVALYNQYVAPYGTGQIETDPDKHQRADQFTVRFDHKLTPAQQFTAYYYFDDDNHTEPFAFFQAAGANVPGFGSRFKTRTQQWNLSHTWTLGSAAVNEFRFNYFREGQRTLNHPLSTFQSVQDSCVTIPAANCFSDPSDPSAGITTNLPGRVGVPYVGVAGGFQIGNNSEGELPQVGNTFQWTDNFTKIVGQHTLKFGVDVRRQRFDQFLYYNVSGLFSFDNTASGDAPSGDDAYPSYFLGTPVGYSQGAAQAENDRNTSLYLFAQDSFKLKSNLTLNYGIRWELNTPYYDTGNRLQTFRPGQVTTKYPCWIYTAGSENSGYNPGDCGQNSAQNSVFPLGLVFPGDPGVPRGLTSTDYKSFAPRVGLAWTPGWTDGWLAKLTGGPGKSSIRAGYGIFYNPIEQLVLEQFSAEPPFGGSSALSNSLFNTPFIGQDGTVNPNPFAGVINQTPQTACPDPSGPNGCVDWASFRPILLFGEFAPHLKTQYAEQYNLTIERQLTQDMLFRIAFVGTQAHHLLASHDLNYGHAETCLELNQILGDGTCDIYSSDSSFFVPPNTPIPTYVPTPGTPATSCTGLYLPYNAGSGGNCITGDSGPNGITLVGLRQYSSPNCQPLTGTGCPVDSVPVFSNIFAEDTIANSNYNALQISLDKSYSHGLLFEASYTFSKAIDQGATFENELDPLDFNFTRGLSLLSAKHRFVFSPVWQIPAPEYGGFEGKVVDGWGVSAIITYQSGFPIRVQDEDDSELMSSIFFESANTPQIQGPVHFTDPKQPGNFFFDPTNFCDGTYSAPGSTCTQPLGTFGNTPHALCCGPAISNTDLVISKKTRINERWDTEFRAEFYNAWNHTQFANPDGNFSDSTFGEILKTREDPRVMQFALKFMF